MARSSAPGHPRGGDLRPTTGIADVPAAGSRRGSGRAEGHGLLPWCFLAPGEPGGRTQAGIVGWIGRSLFQSRSGGGPVFQLFRIPVRAHRRNGAPHVGERTSFAPARFRKRPLSEIRLTGDSRGGCAAVSGPRTASSGGIPALFIHCGAQYSWRGVRSRQQA
jgi:hypothetical protein